MPLYDRSIDTHGFQPLTSASSMENYGLGNFAIDMGLALGMESLGAGFMGAPGIFGRPVLGRIPGVTPGGRPGTTAAQGLYRQMLRRGATEPQAMFVRGLSQPVDVRAAAGGGKKLTRMGLLRAHASTAALQTPATTSLAWRLGVGMGLRTLASAWIINDLFSLGLMGASAAIQGMESFSYERRASLAPSGQDLNLGEGFAETRASFTQRQRAMAAIHNSQMNTRAAMGNEATFMHV